MKSNKIKFTYFTLCPSCTQGQKLYARNITFWFLLVIQKQLNYHYFFFFFSLMNRSTIKLMLQLF